MQIIGADLHTRQQTIAMLDTDAGEVVERTLPHEAEKEREFYAALVGPVQVGIEATGSMHWFLELMEEWGIDRLVGYPSEIRKAETRKQKHDRRDAALRLKLQVENRFPSIGMPSTELHDLRTLLTHRHQWIRMRTRAQNALQPIALSRGLRRGKTLWSRAGQHAIESRRRSYGRNVSGCAGSSLSLEVPTGSGPVCNTKITRITGWRLHVALVVGGSTGVDNRVLVHPECHDRVHREHLSISRPRLPERDVRRV